MTNSLQIAVYAVTPDGRRESKPLGIAYPVAANVVVAAPDLATAIQTMAPDAPFAITVTGGTPDTPEQRIEVEKVHINAVATPLGSAFVFLQLAKPILVAITTIPGFDSRMTPSEFYGLVTRYLEDQPGGPVIEHDANIWCMLFGFGC